MCGHGRPFEEPARVPVVALRRHCDHLLSLGDRRFQTHRHFSFYVFNILQRREILLRTSLKVKEASFATVARMFDDLSLDAIRSICAKLADKEYCTPDNDDERKVLRLMD